MSEEVNLEFETLLMKYPQLDWLYRKFEAKNLNGGVRTMIEEIASRNKKLDDDPDYPFRLYRYWQRIVR